MYSTLDTTFLTHSEYLIQFSARLNQVALLKGIINLRKECLTGGGGWRWGACFAHDRLVITHKQKNRTADVKQKTCLVTCREAPTPLHQSRLGSFHLVWFGLIGLICNEHLLPAVLLPYVLRLSHAMEHIDIIIRCPWIVFNLAPESRGPTKVLDLMFNEETRLPIWRPLWGDGITQLFLASTLLLESNTKIQRHTRKK